MWVKAATRSLIFAASLWATPAFGQTVDDGTRAAARDIGYAGVEAFQRGDYTTANENSTSVPRGIRHSVFRTDFTATIQVTAEAPCVSSSPIRTSA
jgi:hypothetical protein